MEDFNHHLKYYYHYYYLLFFFLLNFNLKLSRQVFVSSKCLEEGRTMTTSTILCRPSILIDTVLIAHNIQCYQVPAHTWETMFFSILDRFSVITYIYYYYYYRRCVYTRVTLVGSTLTNCITSVFRRVVRECGARETRLQ